ncbi:MAG: TatD family hydrolase [Candidatus Micrarchaeia archaeon]
MHFIDSHCHLDAFKNYEEIISKALEAGVKTMITCGCSKGDNTPTLRIAERYPDNVFAVIGIAPQEAMDSDSFDSTISFLKNNRKRIVGVGEIGLDFHWAKTPEKAGKQRNSFELLLNFAISEKLPVVIHSREAEEEVIDILLRSGVERVLLHCFSGSLSLAEKAAEHGFFISIPPTPSRTRERIIKHIPLENLLLESDAPYLAGEPSGVISSAELIAGIKEVNIEEVAEITARNCINLFNLRGLYGCD